MDLQGLHGGGRKAHREIWSTGTEAVKEKESYSGADQEAEPVGKSKKSKKTD